MNKRIYPKEDYITNDDIFDIFDKEWLKIHTNLLTEENIIFDKLIYRKFHGRF